ncbi:MAG: hypothetical protein COA92_09575 [Sulfurovum sp.]|nr:MAG: hypothetical protein COA92_09575 [Sulfurovum sp.]
MSLITIPDVENAAGDVKTVYDEMLESWGVVPEPIKAFSHNSKLLRNAWEMYKIEAQNENFSPKMTTMMRMLISESHACEFCIGFNKGMLMNLFEVSEDEIIALQKDPSNANLDDKQKAMLLFMLKSASSPHDVSKADIDGLKKLGWSEKDIMEGVNQATHMVATALFVDTFKIQ